MTQKQDQFKSVQSDLNSQQAKSKLETILESEINKENERQTADTKRFI